jgi:general secretion pathway protein I
MRARLVTGRIKGFTLLEVLIALIVIALTMSAFIKVSSRYASHLYYLENKTFALWVAKNVANQISIGKIALSKNTSEFSGEEILFRRPYQWTAKVTPSLEGKSIRADILVDLKSSKMLNNDQLSSLIHYVTYYSQS